jgi:hypothetical protein
MGLITTISLAQQASDEFLPEEVGAGANLVVTSVSGPGKAFLNQSISVTYNVKNQGNVASGAYQVGLYLSTDNTIDPATDRLLKNVTFSTGVAPGITKKTTSTVVIPNYHVNGLSGKYYYGAVVATSKKASSKQVSIVRYSFADNNATVIDYKTGLIWQQADDALKRVWGNASLYCAELVLGGYEDWRLPSVDELETIVDYARFRPAIDPVFSCLSDVYWSSSNGGQFSDAAWGIKFDYGSSGWFWKANYLYSVRCVRGGP